MTHAAQNTDVDTTIAPLYAAFVNPARTTDNLNGLAKLLKAILQDEGHHIELCDITSKTTARIATHTLTLTIHRADDACIELYLRSASVDNGGQDVAKGVLAMIIRQAMTVLDPEEIAWLNSDATVAVDTFRGIFVSDGPRRIAPANPVKAAFPVFSHRSATGQKSFVPARAADAEIASLFERTELNLRETFRAQNDADDYAQRPSFLARTFGLGKTLRALTVMTAFAILPSSGAMAAIVKLLGV